MTRTRVAWGILVPTAMMATLWAGCSKGRSEVVATIDGLEVTKEDVYQEIPRPERDQALFSLLVGHLVRQEAEKAGIAVTDQEVSDEIALTYGSMEAFQQHVEHSGLDLATEISRTQTGLLLARLATKDVSLTEEDIQRRFEETKAYYASAPAAKVREIRVVGRESAEDVLRELKTGASFDNLAAERSVSPVPRGDWGWVSQEQLMDLPIQNLATAVFSSSKDDIIGPYEWPVGEMDQPYWSVFWVEDIQTGAAPSLEDERIRKLVERDARLNSPQATPPVELQRRLVSSARIEILSDEFASIQELVSSASTDPATAPGMVPGGGALQPAGE